MDKAFLSHAIAGASELAGTPFMVSLFPSSVQSTITKRFDNSGKFELELPALVAALMFAGTDLEDESDEFLDYMIKEVYCPDSKVGNVFFDSQQDLASFLFGCSVDYVSALCEYIRNTPTRN